eukprot:9142813-Prorocentrum_lima.AAC.1
MQEPFSLTHGVIYCPGTGKSIDYLQVHAGILSMVPMTTFLSWNHGGQKAQLTKYWKAVESIQKEASWFLPSSSGT